MPFEPENLPRWTRPESFLAYSDEWIYSPGAFVFLGQTRDSDSLTRSNFTCALKAIGGESETVRVVRESHWAVGWCEWIAIHESDAAALKAADEITAALSDYPVIDEDHWSELEWNEAAEYWESLSVRGRAEMCREAGLSVFAARRAELPPNDTGALFDLLTGV